MRKARIQIGDRAWLAFENPERVVRADTPDAVRPAIEDVERLTRDLGLHAVGFVAYEAAAAFGLAVSPATPGLPLVWFGLFDPSGVREIAGDSLADTDRRGFEVGELRPSMDRVAFRSVFDQIRTHLRDGDTYQVNLTFALTAPFAGDASAFFDEVAAAQQGRHSAYLELGDWTVCSASPELFFAIDGLTMASRPMKGTARRGRTLAEDALQRDGLHQSAKQRAENVMVVDMIRNDLGRIAEVGSIEVPELFTVERYPNVWQMTSLVSARSVAPLVDIFAALHPCASVTGAPKVRTMQILSELELTPRGVYTGAIGHVRPDGNASFNVAIRTAVIDHRSGTLSFGIGSGIVWDSDADAEYDECLLKASVLTERPVRFDLLETLRWAPGEGYFLLDRHLSRLAEAAEYFGRPLEMRPVRDALEAAVEGAATAQRVRLLIDSNGQPRVERQPLERDGRTLTVAIAAKPVDVRNPFLFHKTTNRSVYDEARVSGVDETILWNADGDVTEALTANLVAEIGGRNVTPPVASGLLAGTYRAELLARGEVEEQAIAIAALRAASRIWLINSLHEWRPAVLRP